MIIARKEELKTLRNTLSTDRSEFIAVYGRRRIGKTFLIREAFEEKFVFQHTGVDVKSEEDKRKYEISAFCHSLKEYGLKAVETPNNWLEAFELLKILVKRSKLKKKVIFIDELSWMHTHRCDLIPALESFWNGWASARKDVVLIVCASATSWMMDNIIHAHGGLYNRLTDEIPLRPFNLMECEDFAKANNLALSKDQIIEAYMILGGVPFYWSLMKKSLSLPQNIDRLFFRPNSPLKGEYDYLFASMFRKPEIYMNIINVLITRRTGIEYTEIQDALGVEKGGVLTKALKDLENCGFIRSYRTLGKKRKGTLFQVIDNFTLFHHKYLDPMPNDPSFWSHSYIKPGTYAWRGNAFEIVCLWHIQQIKQALGISGILTDVCSWKNKENKEQGVKGAQIDLVIDRDDKLINLCELKYSSNEFVIDGDYEKKLKTKISNFRKLTRTKKGVQLTMIAANGLSANTHSGIVQSVVTGEDLFRPEA